MSKPRIEIACSLAFIDAEHRLTWEEAKIIENGIRDAVREALPGHRIRALWVHRDDAVATKQPKTRTKKR